MMKMRIEQEIQKRFDSCKNKVFPYVDLSMKNGDELTVYAPSEHYTGSDDYAIVTDDEEIIHFSSIKEVCGWIYNNYCTK